MDTDEPVAMRSEAERLDQLARELDEQRDLLRSHERVIEAQARELDELRASIRPADASVVPQKAADAAGPVGPAAPTVGRRRLLGAAAGAAVATAAGVVAAQPAAAANGDALLLGQSNAATARTTLRITGTAMPGLFVADSANATEQQAGVIQGYAKGSGAFGLSGFADSSAAGAGVFVAIGADMTSLSTAAIGTGTVGLRSSGERANAHFPGAGTAPTSRSDAHTAGELVVDSGGTTWMCVTSGSPGQWRKLAGSATAGQLHVLGTTTRIYDSRAGFTPTTVAKGQIAGGQVRTLSVNVGGAVPSNALALLANVTVVNTSAAGFLALYKGDIAWPGNSSINWFQPGSVVANMAVVAVAGGSIRVTCAAGASCDFLIDAIGYYR